MKWGQVEWKPVSTLSNTQSPRPIDHTMTSAINMNAEAVMQLQRLVVALSGEVAALKEDAAALMKEELKRH